MGIIDTLSAGFDRVTRRLWLILIPALVDIGIWLGPKLSIHELSQRLLAALFSASELNGQYQQTLDLLQSRLTDLSRNTNILSLFSLRLLGLPSLTGNFTPKVMPFRATQQLIEIPSWPALLSIVILLIMLSLLIGCFCLSLIAQEVREEEPDTAYVLQITWRSWVRLAKLLFAITLLTAMMISGVGILSSLLGIISLELTWLTLNLFAWGLLPLGVYAAIILFFTVRAIILDDLGVLRSLWSSFNIVHRNFFAAIGFLLLIKIVQAGLLYIWRMFTINVVGTMVGIMGNAYVNTGLVIASFIFYRDRFVVWQQARVEKGKQ